MARFRLALVWATTCLPLAGGCGSEGVRHGPREGVGKIYYLDGAGNYGFGQDSVPAGLAAAGYQGDVEVYNWTTLVGGAILDQVLIFNAKIRAADLARRIDAYLDAHPENQVNVIALSAGTGVACWAVKELKAGHQVNNMVLLGSSLSTHFKDMPAVLRRVRGKVYVYYSDQDPVLDVLVRASGTIDREFADSAGLVGLRPPDRADAAVRKLYAEKVVNVAYQPSFAALGYVGDHTSATSEAFIRSQVAPQILTDKEKRRATATYPTYYSYRPAP